MTQLPSTDFSTIVVELKHYCLSAQQAVSGNSDSPAGLQTQKLLVNEKITKVLVFLEANVLPLPDSQIPVNQQTQWLSIKTELQRTARLLKMELAFWQASRSPQRFAQCQQKLADLLQQLVDFCEAMNC